MATAPKVSPEWTTEERLQMSKWLGQQGISHIAGRGMLGPRDVQVLMEVLICVALLGEKPSERLENNRSNFEQPYGINLEEPSCKQ